MIARIAIRLISACALVCVLISCGANSGSGNWQSELAQLGLHAVNDEGAQHLAFREYGSGATTRSLPASDYPNVPVLGADDFLILYGDMPSGPFGTSVSVFSYTDNGGSYGFAGDEHSVESFFSMDPQEMINGQQVTRLVPGGSARPGLYVLHRYVGMNGDAYIPFRIE